MINEWFVESLCDIILAPNDHKWKHELLKDYLRGEIDLDMLKFEMEIRKMINE